MSLSEEIKKYEVMYFAGGQGGEEYPHRAIIKLRRGDGTLIATAFFHRATGQIPSSDTQNQNGQYQCHFLERDYTNVLDILRNEKPVFFEFIGGKWNVGSIATVSEPVGEGE